MKRKLHYYATSEVLKAVLLKTLVLRGGTLCPWARISRRLEGAALSSMLASFVRRLNTFLMFCWPCILIYPYNKNQQDALFTFNLFQYLTSTCFEQSYSSSSGGNILCIQQVVYVMRLCWLAVGRIMPTANQHKRMTFTHIPIAVYIE